MVNLAFMFDRGTADLISPTFLWVPLIVTFVCWCIMAKNRRFVGYALGLAAIPAACVIARLFFKTLQFDLRDYPTEQSMMALFVAFFPFAAIGVFHIWLARRQSRIMPNQSPEPPQSAAH